MNAFTYTYICVCVCIHIYYVHTHTHIYIYIHTHTHTHTFFSPLYQEIFIVSFLKLSGFSRTEVSKFNDIFWQFLHGMKYDDIIEVIYIY